MGLFSIFDGVQYGPYAARALRSRKFMGLILVFSTEGCSMSDLVSSDRSGVHKLFYDRPAATWLEALPLGNGRIGAMCFGGVGSDRIGLNDETLWSGSPETARLLSTPLGATGADAVDAVREALWADDIRRAHELAGGFHSGY